MSEQQCSQYRKSWRCADTAVFGYLQCDHHRKQKRDARNRHRANDKICNNCLDPRAPGRNRCTRHLKENAAASKAAQARRLYQ